jgi:hypothetical protein
VRTVVVTRNYLTHYTKALEHRAATGITITMLGYQLGALVESVLLHELVYQHYLEAFASRRWGATRKRRDDEGRRLPAARQLRAETSSRPVEPCDTDLRVGHAVEHVTDPVDLFDRGREHNVRHRADALVRSLRREDRLVGSH